MICFCAGFVCFCSMRGPRVVLIVFASPLTAFNHQTLLLIVKMKSLFHLLSVVIVRLLSAYLLQLLAIPASLSTKPHCIMRRVTAAASPRSLLPQLPWLAQMMHAAAACPIFGCRHTRNQLQPLAWLGIQPFLSAPQLSRWLCDTTSNSRRKLSNRSRRRLLCFVQLGVVASRMCFFAHSNIQRRFSIFSKIIIRRCLSVRGVNLLLNKFDFSHE